MQITRQNHLRYMTKVTPLLLLLYVFQLYLYKTFAPAHMSSDIGLLLGVGLAFIIVCYHFYDHHHKIICHENYFEVRFDLLGMQEEILYSNITEVELKKKNDSFGHIIIHLRNGGVFHFHHVDHPETVQEFIERKRTKRN